MSLAELKNIQANYEDTYFGLSDKAFGKLILDATIDTLKKHKRKLKDLDDRVKALEGA